MKSKRHWPRIKQNIVRRKDTYDYKTKQRVAIAAAALKKEAAAEKHVIFAHYGQMDGYPDGAGRVLADFIRDIAPADDGRDEYRHPHDAPEPSANELRFIDRLSTITQYDDREHSPVDELGSVANNGIASPSSAEATRSLIATRAIPLDDYLARSRSYPEGDRRGALLLGTILHGKRWFEDATSRDFACYVENAKREAVRASLIIKQEAGVSKKSESRATPSARLNAVQPSKKEIVVKKEDSGDDDTVHIMHRACGPVSETDTEWTYHVDLDARTLLVVWRNGHVANHTRMSKLLTFEEFTTLPMCALQLAFTLADSAINADADLSTKGKKPTGGDASRLYNGCVSDRLLAYCVATVQHMPHFDAIPDYFPKKSTFTQQQSTAAMAAIYQEHDTTPAQAELSTSVASTT